MVGVITRDNVDMHTWQTLCAGNASLYFPGCSMAVLLNNLGSTSELEMNILMAETIKYLGTGRLWLHVINQMKLFRSCCAFLNLLSTSAQYFSHIFEMCTIFLTRKRCVWWTYIHCFVHQNVKVFGWTELTRVDTQLHRRCRPLA